MRLVQTLIIGLVLAIAFGAIAKKKNPRQLGPFRLGSTPAEFRAAAKRAGFTKPRLQVPQERDMMGLGLFNVQPITTESRELAAQPGKIWQVTAYLLSDRVAYLSIDYKLEDIQRRKGWHHYYDAPVNARNALQDGAWERNGVVLYADRFGTALHAVDWGGLKRSDRVLVSLEGAIKQANEFFRRLRARQAEASLDYIRRQTLEYMRTHRGQDRRLACKPPKSVAFTPGASACDVAAKRFPPNHKSWGHSTWSKLGVNNASLSRYYAFSVESSGEMASARITLLAVGDLDCDGNVATLRVRLTAESSANARDCKIGEGVWEIINPFE